MAEIDRLKDSLDRANQDPVFALVLLLKDEIREKDKEIARLEERVSDLMAERNRAEMYKEKK